MRINDDGVDNLHPEFSSKFDLEGSCEEYAPRRMSTDVHGTGVASIVAGSANHYCAVGVAPDATISSCFIELQATTPAKLGSVLDVKLDQMDVSVNSWGIVTCFRTSTHRRIQEGDNCTFAKDHAFSPCDYCHFNTSTGGLNQHCETSIVSYCALYYEDDYEACSEYLDLFTKCEYNALSPEQQTALVNGVHNGRDGKGIIYVFAAGNSYSLGGDANFDGWVNSRFTISAAAVGKDGLHASYSTTGSALFIAAPGGDIESLRNNIVAMPGGGCHDITVGTSFAAPFTAGVVTLMLDTNPDLGWRDIQGILAMTSTKTDSMDDSWTTNAAGFNHSYKYGFGIVNAEEAVKAAASWTNFDNEKQLLAESGVVNVTIIDDPAFTSSSAVLINEESGADFVVETVVVYLDLLDGSRGDLEIVLTSPGRTDSILHPGMRPENTQLPSNERWKLMTVRNWGEGAAGEWKLSLVDKAAGVLSECVDKPFQFVWSSLNNEELNGAVTTCATLEMARGCANGTALSNFVSQIEDESGVTPVEACCACGGGMPAPKASMLRSWRMVVYGHRLATETSSVAPSPVSFLVSGVGESGGLAMIAGFSPNRASPISVFRSLFLGFTSLVTPHIFF